MFKTSNIQAKTAHSKEVYRKRVIQLHNNISKYAIYIIVISLPQLIGAFNYGGDFSKNYITHINNDVNIVAATARTFILDGVTTEYPTEILATAANDARLYTEVVKKKSRVLYDGLAPSQVFAYGGEYNTANEVYPQPVYHTAHPLPLSQPNNFQSHLPNLFLPASSCSTLCSVPTYTVEQLNNQSKLSEQPKYTVAAKDDNLFARNEKTARVQPSSFAAITRQLSTITYYGFADFTTVVGESVIIFSPNTPSSQMTTLEPTRVEPDFMTLISSTMAIEVVNPPSANVIETTVNIVQPTPTYVQAATSEVSFNAASIEQATEVKDENTSMEQSEESNSEEFVQKIKQQLDLHYENTNSEMDGTKDESAELLASIDSKEEEQSTVAPMKEEDYVNLIRPSKVAEETETEPRPETEPKAETEPTPETEEVSTTTERSAAAVVQSSVTEHSSENMDRYVIKEIDVNDINKDENCKLTSKVFLTYVPAAITPSSTVAVAGSAAANASSAQPIVPNINVQQVTKYYCIQTQAPKQQEPPMVMVKATQNHFSPQVEILENKSESSLHAMVINSEPPRNENENQKELNENESSSSKTNIELIYKTLYTVYTYLTTYFHNQTSSFLTQTKVFSNVVISGLENLQTNAENAIQYTKSVGDESSQLGFFEPEPYIQLENDVEKCTTCLAPSLSIDMPEKQATLFTTYTFYTTIYEGTSSRVVLQSAVLAGSIEDVEPTLAPELIAGTSTSQINAMATQLAGSSIVIMESMTNLSTEEDEILELQAQEPANVATTESLSTFTANIETTTAEPEAQEEEETTILAARETLETYTANPGTSELVTEKPEELAQQPTPETLAKITENTIAATLTTAESSVEQQEELAILTTTEALPTFRANADGLLTQHEPFETKSIIDVTPGQEFLESNNTSLTSKAATLVLQTGFTTHTYYTTIYTGDTADVISRLETVTTTRTETYPILESTVANEALLPITYYTTFTFWTKLATKDQITTISREETISNVVTPTAVLQGRDDYTKLTNINETQIAGILGLDDSKLDTNIILSSKNICNSSQLLEGETCGSPLAASELEYTKTPSLDSVESQLAAINMPSLAETIAEATPSLVIDSLVVSTGIEGLNPTQIDKNITAATANEEVEIKLETTEYKEPVRIPFQIKTKIFTPPLRPFIGRGRNQAAIAASKITESVIIPTLAATPANLGAISNNPALAQISSSVRLEGSVDRFQTSSRLFGSSRLSYGNLLSSSQNRDNDFSSRAPNRFSKPKAPLFRPNASKLPGRIPYSSSNNLNILASSVSSRGGFSSSSRRYQNNLQNTTQADNNKNAFRLRKPINKPQGFTANRALSSNAQPRSTSSSRNPVLATSRFRPSTFPRPSLSNALKYRLRGSSLSTTPVQYNQPSTSYADGNGSDNSICTDPDDPNCDSEEEDDSRRRRRRSLDGISFDDIAMERARRRNAREAQSLKNARSRFRRPRPTAEPRMDDEPTEEIKTTTHSSKHSSRSRFDFGSKVTEEPATTGSTTKAKSGFNKRVIRPSHVSPAPTGRAKFTLRDREPSTTTTQKSLAGKRAPFRKPQAVGSIKNKRPSTSPATNPLVGKRRLGSNSKTEESTPSRSTSSHRSRPSSGRSRSGSFRDTDSRNRHRGSVDNNNEVLALDNSGTITVTHVTPSETSIPVVNGGSTEFKRIITAKTSTEVLGPQQYSKAVGANGQISLALTSESSGVNGNGATEVVQFFLREVPTSTVTFTPTTIRGRKTSFSYVLPSTAYSVDQVTSTITPQIQADTPLANILLSQLLLGNVGVGFPTNLLYGLNTGAPAQPALPTTEYRTHTSTYVTTLIDGKSTVVPLTFQGKKIFTTIFDTIAQTITATEFVTETIVITPTAASPQAPMVNSLLLQQLLLQQVNNDPLKNFNLNQAKPTSPPLIVDNDHDLELENRIHDSEQPDLSQGHGVSHNDDLPETFTERSKKKSNKKHKRKHKEESKVDEASIVTLYVSGRRPGEFSTILSTVRPDGSVYKRDIHATAALYNAHHDSESDFEDDDSNSYMDENMILAVESGEYESQEATQPLTSIVGDVNKWYVTQGTALSTSATATATEVNKIKLISSIH